MFVCGVGSCAYSRPRVLSYIGPSLLDNLVLMTLAEEDFMSSLVFILVLLSPIGHP